MRVNLKAAMLCVHFLLLRSCYTFAQIIAKDDSQRDTNVFLIDYVNGNSSLNLNTSVLFLHLQDKIIQLKGKAVSPDSVRGFANCISIDSLYSLSTKELLQLSDGDEVFVKFQVDGVSSCYKISDVAIYFSEGSKLLRANAEGEKVLYADLQDSPDSSAAMKKLPNGSIKIDPAKAYRNRTYVRSKFKINCFFKYEIIVQQGKHSSAVFWIPEVGVIQERAAGYEAIKAVQINGKPTKEFLKSMCH